MYRKITVCILLYVTVTECCECSDKKKKSDRRLTKFFSAKSLPVEKPKRLKSQLHNTGNEIAELSDVYEWTTQEIDNHNNYYTENLQRVCVYFQHNDDLEFDKMVDMWEIVYYRTSMQLNCFKFVIRKVPYKTRMMNKRKYGDFNGTINWEQCELQIISNAKEPTTHYLQGEENQKGVLQNIILTEDSIDETTTITLHDHTPNQWLVVNDLLLMRECDNGDLLVFTRVPYQPRQQEVFEALVKFREEPKEAGKWACRPEPYEPITKYLSINRPRPGGLVQQRKLKRRKVHSGRHSRKRCPSTTSKPKQ